MRAFIGTLAAVIVMTCAGALSDTTALAQTSYPLVCRGGGAMAFEIAYVEGYAVLVVRFSPASQPANTSAPRAGECAWLDRGVGPDEPAMFGVRFADVNIFATIQANGTLQNVRFPYTSGERGAAQRAQQAETLIGDIRAGRPFQLQARQGNLVGYRLLLATRLGP